MVAVDLVKKLPRRPAGVDHRPDARLDDKDDAFLFGYAHRRLDQRRQGVEGTLREVPLLRAVLAEEDLLFSTAECHVLSMRYSS